MKKLSSSLSLALLLMLNASAVTSAKQTSLGEVSHQVFIGQSYPSGNVYLKSFTGSKDWPKELSLIPLVEDADTRGSGILKAVLFSGVMPSAYIPALEAMDDQHDACGSGETKKVEPAFQYLSDDFFDAMVDHCEANDDVAVYRSSSSQSSFKVLAFGSGVTLTEIRHVTGLRPITPAEQQELAQQKQQPDKNATGCTTVPAFIDSATRLVEASMGGGLTLRVSSYKDPGCAGHLATIYILDVLRETNVLTTFRIIQNQGVL